MNKTLYYIELTCIKDCKYPNVEFHKGDILYFNKNASSNEMYLFNHTGALQIKEDIGKYRGVGSWSYLPFTRKKANAKKWEIRRYPEHVKESIEKEGEFHCRIVDIKVSYTIED